MTSPNPSSLARSHRLARGLSDEQLARLLAHSEHACEQCSQTGSVYLQHTEGSDPTTWMLCGEHHARPDASSLYLSDEYADYLREPLAEAYGEHLRLMHDDEPWGINRDEELAALRAIAERSDPLDTLMGDAPEQDGFHAALTPEEAIAPALASEAKREALLSEADEALASEPELERLRRLPTTDPLARAGRGPHIPEGWTLDEDGIARRPEGPSREDIASACEQLSRELSSPEMAAALERCDALLDAEDERLSAEAMARVPEGASVRKPGQRGAGLILRHAAFCGTVYVRWDVGSGLRLSWENPEDLELISRPLTPAEQASYDANVAEAQAHEAERMRELRSRLACPSCGRPHCPRVCPACGTERLS